MPEQIPLGLPAETNYSVDSFILSDSNAEAVKALRDTASWPNNLMAVCGGDGVGKTHLGHIWAKRTGAANSIETAQGGCLWLDDAQYIPEARLFDLINRCLTGNLDALLLTSIDAPADWPVTIADLGSRLKSIPVIAIQDPDDALLKKVYLKLFRDRGLIIPDSLVNVLIKYAERSVPAALGLVEELDLAALKSNAKLTRNFVSRFAQQNLL